MARHAVPIFSGHGGVRRPSRADLLKAACPRDLAQLPKLFLGIAIALFVLGYALTTAHVAAAISLQWAAAVFLGGFLAFHATTWLLVKLKRIDTARLEATEGMVVEELNLPVSVPVEDARLDTSYAPAERADAAVQANVARHRAQDRTQGRVRRRAGRGADVK